MNNQDRKKFKNMDITGVVQVQCSHIFVKSTVDMQLGERFANTDYALAHAIQQHVPPASEGPHLPGCDTLVSYDISCGYCVHVVDRFTKQFPSLASTISKIRWLIPLVHVNNHQENCDYLFSCAFIMSACHFFGETAEHIWPHSNLLGPQTRQMNNGHRQDTIIDHNNDWNYKKMVNLATMLFNELKDAQRLAAIKRNAFVNLSYLFSDRIAEWNQADRSARTRNKQKQIVCVYRHSQPKAPSQARVHQMLLDELASSSTAKAVKGTGLASFLNEGVSIMRTQWRVKAMADAHKSETPSEAQSNRLERERANLQDRIDKFRKSQRDLMPQLGNHVEAVHQSTNDQQQAESIKLLLPSDFDDAERISLNLTAAAEAQRQLLDGAAFDVLHRIRTIVKGLNATRNDKKKNAIGQKPNTRANTDIRDLQTQRLQAINEYNTIRLALFSLGVGKDDPTFPFLTVDDTELKRTDSRRQPGDTHRTDGAIWTKSGVTLGDLLPAGTSSKPAVLSAAATRASLGVKGSLAQKRIKSTFRGAKRGTKRRDERVQDAKDAERVARKRKPDAWLWKFAPGRLNQQELADWIDEGDRVQWFRAEAEMQRWQEQVEKKQADFLHAIRYFNKLSQVWLQLGSRAAISDQLGRAAYARRTSATFAALEETATGLFKEAGYGDRLPRDGTILSDFVQADRDMLPDVVAQVVAESDLSSDSEDSMDVD